MLAVLCVGFSATVGTLFVATYRFGRQPGPHDPALLLVQCIVQVVAIALVVVALFTRKPSRVWIRRPAVMVTLIVVAVATPFVVMPWLMTKWRAPFVPLAPPILGGTTDGKGLSATLPTPVGRPLDISNQFELTVISGIAPMSAGSATSSVTRGRAYLVKFTNGSGISISIADSVRIWLDTPGGRVPVGPCPATTESVQLDKQVAPKGAERGALCFPDAPPDSLAVIVTEPVKTVNTDVDRRYLATP